MGSFFNVLIYRLPAEESVVSPGSHCPKCGHVLKWYENIPMLSYLFLGRKCSSCKVAISSQYFWVELLTGLLSLALYFFYFKALLTFELGAVAITELVLVYVTLILVIPISVIDFRHYIIPDSLSLGGLALGFAASFLPGGVTPQTMLLGILAGGGVLWLFGFIGELVLKKEAMGGGDIKMLAWFGALFGPAVAAGSIFVGAFAGLAIFLIGSVIGLYSKEKPIPFGPALYVGMIVSLLWGAELWQWYQGFFMR